MNHSKTLGASLTGIWFALAIIIFWFASLIFLLFQNLNDLSPIGLVLAFLSRTFLQTGLFIIGHDAMHRSLMAWNRSINDSLGELAVGLYAFLPYQHCRSNHGKHHHTPAQLGDPDFHDGQHTHPFCWYIKFMREYLSFGQLATLLCTWGLCFLILKGFTQTALLNVLLFWAAPLLFSSVQLFVFGTYLPHREKSGELNSSHRIKSTSYPVLLSLLTCYHFGYHWEHHEYPKLPWYKLPSVRPQLEDSSLRPDWWL
jgi:beta-carotene/zeaxanthin 4-ketolase